MRKIVLLSAVWAAASSCVCAQIPVEKTLETFSTAIGRVGLGTPENEFFLIKTDLKQPSPSGNDFRDEVIEPIGKDNLASITYYFDKDGEGPLYEFILEFSDEATRSAVAEKLFGEPNYPGKPDHWIAGAEDNVVTMAWAVDKKLVIAANLPGTEWNGDELFNIPPGFELYKHLPQMSEWPEAELNSFFDSLGQQIAAGASDFSTIRGEEVDGYYTCTAPLAGAESTTIFKNDDGKWVIGNTMISGANAENSILWKLDAENLFGKTDREKLKLTRIKSQPGFGGTVDLWEVSDKSGKETGVLVGMISYEWGAEGLWSIDVLVMRK